MITDLQQLTTKEQAEKVLNFFYRGRAFTWELPEWQRDSIKRRIENALEGKEKCRYWLFENEKGDVIAAGAAEEDEAKNGGFFIGWLGVHEDYRRHGLGRKIIEKAEEYVRSLDGRFITVDTGEDNQEANTFYKSLGYKQVGLIPDYYKEGAGKVFYYKKVG